MSGRDEDPRTALESTASNSGDLVGLLGDCSTSRADDSARADDCGFDYRRGCREDYFIYWSVGVRVFSSPSVFHCCEWEGRENTYQEK